MERSRIIRVVLFVLSILVIVAALLFYKSIISYLVVAFIAAYIFSPVINYGEIYNISRTLSILIVYIVLAILIIVISNVVIPLI